MARPKSGGSSQDPSERDRTNVLLEEMHSEIKRLSDGQAQLGQTMDRQIGQLREEMNQRFSVIEQVVKQNSADIQQNSQDIKAVQQALCELRQEVKLISDRMKEHERAHAN